MTYDVSFDRQRVPGAILTPFSGCVVGNISLSTSHVYQSFTTSINSNWEDEHFEEMVSQFFRSDDFRLTRKNLSE